MTQHWKRVVCVRVRVRERGVRARVCESVRRRVRVCRRVRVHVSVCTCACGERGEHLFDLLGRAWGCA